MTLDPVWTIYDPLADCTIDEVDFDLSIIIPSGTAHEGLNAPRILQDYFDTDFTIETRIDSDPTTDKQGCGIVAEQDHNNLIMVSITSGYFVEVLKIESGIETVVDSVSVSPTFPHWLKLERSGNDWIVSLSTDGVMYTEVITVSLTLTIAQAGLFALTGGTNPAWNGLFDIFIADGISPEEDLDVIELLEAIDYYDAFLEFNNDIEEQMEITDSYDAFIVSNSSVRWRYVSWKETTYYVTYKPPISS